uniref:Beta-1,3 exoglucanase-like protein n=1 Tax=Pleurotus djamor TaxID=34470 RepID=Q68ST8_PLEDJ|nr:beta-1,3 exoglucanase precursor-like protein [Pleurotus djamor]
MTVDTCVAFCKTNGYLYAGVEFGQECCKLGIFNPSDSQCNMPCTGNNKQTCGAGDRINIFYSGGKKPDVPNRVKTWKYSGCFVDSVENRALERPMPIASGVTAQSCTAACKDAGFKFAGLEFGAECFCGNDLDSSKVNENQCQTACAADTKQFCGGPDRLTVFTDTSRPTPPKGPGGPKPHGHH